MNQPLYTEQDNQALNAQIETKVTQGARGDNMAINHIDELAFFPAGAEQETAKKIQQSTAFGSHAHPSGHENKVRSFTEGGIEAVQQATSVIDPTTGKPHAFNFTPEMIRQAQAQVAAGGGAVVLGNDGTTKMFNNIKDMFTNDVKKEQKTETYFTGKNTKFHFEIDRTIFEPSPVVRLSPKQFEKNYLQQLESYIYNTKDELDPEKLFALIYLVGYLKEGHFPIKLVSGKHRIQLPKIINTMNLFFNKNKSVIFGIATMFNGMTQMPQQEETKAE